MRYVRVFASLILSGALVTLTVPAGGQGPSVPPADDPLLGTWHLDVAKSTYRPGPPPRSQTRTYEKHRFGLRATVRTVQADGHVTTVQTVYDYNNEEYPVTGSEEVDAVRVKRIDEHTHEATLRHAGKEIGSFRRVISKDGKQMTVTLRRTAPRSVNVEVYDKEEVR